MKKTIGLLLVITMVIFSFAYAETIYNVNLYGGVHFGMTENEVAYEIQQQGYNIRHFSNAREDCWSTTAKDIGGFKDTQVTYWYNILGKLEMVRYLFGVENYSDANRNEVYKKYQADFDTAESGLISKYGETEYSAKTNKTIQLNNKVIDDDWAFYSDGKNFWEKQTVVDYSERIVEYGDGTYLLIEHVLFDDVTSSGSSKFGHMMCYTHYREDLSPNGTEANEKESLTQEEKMANDF